MAPGYEADDLLATLTHRLRAAGHEVVIVTGDKDLARVDTLPVRGAPFGSTILS